MANDAQAERTDNDIYRLSDQIDAETVRTIADRLEFRASDPGYVAVSQGYFERLPVTDASRVLAIGCGTGVEVRALHRLIGSSGQIIGVDQSDTLIDAARQITANEGITDGVEYVVGDAHDLDFPDETFDITLLHTLISHVDQPLDVLRESRRVTKRGGTIAVFDGDYASVTFGYPDAAVEADVEAALMKAIIANPRIMRDMPRLVSQADLELVAANGYLYADIGTGSFWANVPETYAGVLSSAGGLEAEVIEEWRRYQAESVETNSFFGASNYYTYIMRRPE